MRLKTTVLAGVAALLASQVAHAEKNYLVVIIDDAAVDKVSSYVADYPGYAPTYMPNTLTLDTLASRGLRFTHAWATPECTPTRISFETGVYPSRHGFGKALGMVADGMDWLLWIDPATGRSTLAQEFADQGYATAHFGKWHKGTLDAAGNGGAPAMGALPAAPNAWVAGYDRFWGATDGLIYDYLNWTRVEWRDSASAGTVATETTHATKATQQKALDWINQQGTDPWFAVVAFNAPHSGSGASSNWQYADVQAAGVLKIETRTAGLGTCLAASNCADRDRQVYQGLMEDVDIKIRKLLNGMDPAVLENTLVVVFGDNGTPTAVAEAPFNAVGRGKSHAYEVGVRVPLIIADGYAWVHGFVGPTPTITSINQVIDAKVSIVDLYNTLLEDASGATNPLASDSSSFGQCFTHATDPNHWCDWTGKRYGYSEYFNSNASTTNAQAIISYGLDTMTVNTWNAGLGCFTNEFWDGAVDPLQTAAVVPWAGVRSQRLRDRFVTMHTGIIDWANPTGAAVLALCN